MVKLPDSADRFTPYFLYEERLKSFDDRWPHKSQNLSPERMAKAGFFFLPDEADSDSVRCPFCLKNLTGWEENDDPMIEHEKRKENCYFMQLNKLEEDYTVEDFLVLAAHSRSAAWVNFLFLI
ncbi:unnamed protein product [Dracunculus medinensis]|uniref:Baculoviral IAP repeat-containing protein 5.1 n=1 Tax=Dracunculus medinensis TaxID=318479 RepID=A0A0N4UD68_DRAME|nr:unnamed protein product [Dracunculus medinensis]